MHGDLSHHVMMGCTPPTLKAFLGENSRHNAARASAAPEERRQSACWVLCKFQRHVTMALSSTRKPHMDLIALASNPTGPGSLARNNETLGTQGQERQRL